MAQLQAKEADHFDLQIVRWLGQRYASQGFIGGRLMKALQRLVVTAHWLALFWGGGFIAFYSYRLASGQVDMRGDAWLKFFGVPVAVLFPIVAVAFVLWIFTGKFILWPWNRPLPKQED